MYLAIDNVVERTQVMCLRLNFFAVLLILYLLLVQKFMCPVLQNVGVLNKERFIKKMGP